jgi:hypothetical protein
MQPAAATLLGQGPWHRLPEMVAQTTQQQQQQQHPPMQPLVMVTERALDNFATFVNMRQSWNCQPSRKKCTLTVSCG